MSSSWELKSIGEIATIEGGYAFSSRKFVSNGKYQVVKMSNLYGGELDLERSASFLDSLNPDEERYLLRKNDILITLTGTTGKRDYGYSYLIQDELNLLLNQRVARIKVNENMAAAYIAYQLSTPMFLNQFFEISKGGTGNQTNVGTGDIAAIKLLVPPLPEQIAIATALRGGDQLIRELDRLIAKKRAIRQVVTQELLTGRRRLSANNKKWEIVTLGELFLFKNGLNKGKEFFGTGTPIVNYMDVFKNSYFRSTDLSGSVSVTSQELKNFEVKIGDVFFTRTSETPEEVGLASVVLDEPKQTVFSGFLLRARPKNERLCNEFKAFCFKTDSVRSQIISKASYTTRALTNGRILSGVVMQLPPKDEQLAIATILSDMNAEIKALEQRRDKTKLIKQGMMQELLTGRTRLV